MKQTTLALAAAFLLSWASAPAAVSPTTVHIRDFAFKPAALHIRVGDRVRFVNDDDDAHTVEAVNRSFASPGLDTGDSWTHAFTKSGTFVYFCTLHPYMKGTIVVLPRAS